jgi:hypothetical protein
MTNEFRLIRYWGIFEYAPFAGGERKRCLVIRERQSECQEILNALEKSNINFEVYRIEGITP